MSDTARGGVGLINSWSELISFVKSGDTTYEQGQPKNTKLLRSATSPSFAFITRLI